MDEALLIFHMRPARAKARSTAAAEALCLLRDLAARDAPGGPLSAEGGVFWVSLPRDLLEEARSRLPWLGYSCAVDVVDSALEGERPGRGAPLVRWRRRSYRLVRVYEEDAEAFRERAPDRRSFALETDAGVHEVRGYRGDSGPLSRRGLPVEDARMLVNLVSTGKGGRFLDPFAGVGGIAIEALAHGYDVLTGDIDPSLRHGLARLGAAHAVADARMLPLGAGTIDAIATEPPYERAAEGAVIESLGELRRVLRDGGRLAVLCSVRQADGLRRQAASLGLAAYHEEAIDRKGTECAVLAWEKG